jgi:beta-lactamase superfamily II metal-dependent hydrolase
MTMIFTLEALRAAHGDCLILHYGEPGAPRFLLIDGGPTGVYADALRPRLDQLAQRLPQDGKLPLDVVMVSHMDDDHIRGILDLTDALLETRDVEPSPFRVGTLWHNAFEDAVGATAAETVGAAVAEAPARIAAADGEAQSWDGRAEAVIASVPQARKLRDNARGLGWKANDGFGEIVSAPSAGGGRSVKLGPLSLTVVGPLQDEVAALRARWQEQVRKLRQGKDAPGVAEAAEYLDRSVYNLSSIVCLAELGGKRVLLTGDALGSRVLEGLAAAGLMDADGRIAVDVLKVPHHGSSRNVEQGFFEQIHARHLVISGNGKFDNPEPATLRMISQARPDDDFTLHLTYERFQGPIDAEIDAFLAAERQAGRRYEVRRRPDADLSLRVDLLDRIEV